MRHKRSASWTVVLGSVLGAGMILGASGDVWAQCNRGGSMAGSMRGLSSPLGTTGGFTSPLAMQNRLAASAQGTQTPLGYTSAMARQQLLAAQQMQYMQLMAQRQLAQQAIGNGNPITNGIGNDGSDIANNDAGGDSTAETRSSDAAARRRLKQRQANALKAFTAGQRAAANGKSAAAEKLFVRAISLASEDTALTERVQAALASLPNRSSTTTSR